MAAATNRATADANRQLGKWLSEPLPGEEVVVSGMAGRFPESNNVSEFLHHLMTKTEMVSSDGRRWTLDHPEIPQRTAKIYNIDRFDAGHFGLHYRQANIMDPMMRKFLEIAIEAVMDAGLNPSELEGSNTGVFVSTSWSDMENDTLVNTTEPQRFPVTGYTKSLIANRLSYYLKLKGPSFVIDTACSSSLNALDHAFRSIRSGKCDAAIVGGLNLLLHPGNSLQFFRLGVLSIEGVCKVFDQDAKGYVRGETTACVLLQKAKNSRRIYGKIINTKVNSDGFKEQGITFPSTEAQRRLMTEIYEESRVHPSALSFLEAHGTGTQVGDPQEIEALDCAIAKKRQETLLIGSVKCSIGHTEPASGLCSLVKVLLAMELGQISPNINLKRVKRGMEGLEQGRMKVVTEVTHLEQEEAVIGINNFGFGGNNCHAIVRRFAKVKTHQQSSSNAPKLVCVSGRTEESVLMLLDEVSGKFEDREYVGLLHHIFKKDIATHLYRGFTVLSRTGALATSCTLFAQRRPRWYLFFGPFENNYKALGRRLLNFPFFESLMLRVNGVLSTANIDIFDKISKNGVHTVDDLLGAVAVQMGVVALLKVLEIEATAVYGDLTGQLVSAFYYETLTLEQTVLSVLQEIQKYQTRKHVGSDEQTNNTQFDYCIERESNVKNYRGDALSVKYMCALASNSTLLNISDQRFTEKDVIVVQNNSVTLLEVIGTLYEQGHNPQLHKLYADVEYPVSRGTPMISPSLSWDYSKSWHTYKFSQFFGSDSEQKEFNISFLYDEHKFIGGHVIDGRNLFPATEYLNLVWQTFAQSRRLLTNDLPVVFENCRFVRAVTMQKSGFRKLLVSIQKGTGQFEVLEKNSLVVSGRIYDLDNTKQCRADLPLTVLDEDNPVGFLEQDEIYRELYIRGYNYSGLFKGIVKCNVDASAGLIQWENNWCTFMDKMLQMKILQIDTRLLYVPVGIKKLTIDPLKHLEAVGNFEEECLIPVHVYKESNIITSGGIEIHGLQAKSVMKKKQRLEPVLEKYEFVANNAELELMQVLRVNTQIILENSLESNFKAVEILDDELETQQTHILPLMCSVLDDIPVVNPDLTISTKTVLPEIPGVKAENVTLTPTSNLLLIVGTNLLQKPKVLKQILSSLSPQGFVLSREDHSYVTGEEEEEEMVDVLTEYRTPDEKIILLRAHEQPLATAIVEISSDNLHWLQELRESLKPEGDVVVYGRNVQPNGAMGLVNCIRREPGGSKVRCFFVMDEAPAIDLTLPFYRDQMRKRLAFNVYRNFEWGTYRHSLLEPNQEIDCEHCYVTSMVRGDLSSLKWFEGPLRPQTALKDGQVLVHTYYSAINFKDIMIASGRINVDVITMDRRLQEAPLGFEYSGRDLSGRRVTGMINNQALSTIVVGDTNFLWEVPDQWCLEEAATVPVVYSTVVYALSMVAELKPGSRILIHSATGGIGMAALNVCLYHECEVFVTVGTQEKRDYLKKHYPQIPDGHVGNSHDNSYEELIRVETGGRGVDIVLNSLSEEKLKGSVRCLAQGGVLLEIGKFDLANDTSLNLLLMKKEISYHGIMLDQIFSNSPELKVKLCNAISKGIKFGYIRPLPHVVFERDQVEEAFRHMTTGKHIGKVLVRIRDEEEQKVTITSKALFRGYQRFHCNAEKSYVIVGGLGGIGLELADWLVVRGCQKLVLTSRTGIQTGYQTQRLGILRSYGVTIRISTEDVTSEHGCYDLLKAATDMGPIDAIFNLAAVLQDGLFENQTEEKFQISLAPKAQATKNLDQISRKYCPQLRYFVIFSSVSCGRGNAGQSNYGMANSIMERICERRKLDGLPAVAIQWGAIGDVGLVAKMQKENKELVIGGTLQQKISSCLEVLDTFLKQENPVVASMVVAEKHNRNYDTGNVVDVVTYILGIKDIKTVSQHATLAELGMDSMMGTEVIQRLEKDFDIYITAKEVRSLTFARLIEIEEEKKSSEDGEVSKAELASKVLIKYIPDGSISSLPVIKLVSRVKDGEEAPTILIFCGIEGVFLPLEPLVKNLKAHVLGIQYNYRDPEDSVEEEARNLLPHVEANLSKDETFHLIGYSYGATIVCELASTLEAKGFLGKVIILDGSPSYLSSSAKEYLPSENEDEFQTILMCKILSTLLPIGVLEQSKEKFMLCQSLEERIDFASALIPSNIVHRQKLEKQAAFTLYKRFKAVIKYAYAHDKIKSLVYLFRAKYTMLPDEEPDYQLSKICEQHVQVTTIEGDHATMLNQAVLAEEINKLL